MRIEENNYFITEKFNFSKEKFDETYYTIEEIFNFAYDMTFGKNGEHRNYRSGGTHRRKNGEIFSNTFQGKLAEAALYTKLKNTNKNPMELDLETYDLGKWDFSDIECSFGKIAVKSTKFYGNLLLLETKDWDYNGEYIPNGVAYDFIFLIRINGDIEKLMKDHRLLYSNECSKDKLKNIILKETWTFDIPGYITLKQLKILINKKQIIPQGALLNGVIPMDAENYYEETGKLVSAFNK